jgi:hypothetical protein
VDLTQQQWGKPQLGKINSNGVNTEASGLSLNSNGDRTEASGDYLNSNGSSPLSHCGNGNG